MNKKYLFLAMFVIGIFNVETIFAKGVVGITSNSSWGGTDTVRIISNPPKAGDKSTYDYTINVSKDVVDITASFSTPATYYADGVTISRPASSGNFHCVMTVDTINAKSNFNFQLYRDTLDMFNQAGANMLIDIHDIGQDGGCDEAQLYDFTNNQMGNRLYPDWYYSDPASASNNGGGGNNNNNNND